MQIGFIGLGHMGQGMARRLLDAGHILTVYNRSRDKAQDLAGHGARIAETPADAAGGDVLITMLTGDAALEAVLHGRHGALPALHRGAVHISMSTISLSLSERLAALHGEAGQGYLAAPVFGRPEAAAAGKLFIVAGGDGALIERCRPLFEAMGQRLFVAGPQPQSANLIKLSGNFLIASVLESLGEAFALVRKGGIDPQTYLEILTGSLFPAPLYQNYGAMIAQQRHPPGGFSAALGLKDVRLALAAADAQQVPMPVASVIHDRLLTLVAQGHGEGDWSALARLSAEQAGLK
jgi:3-hydroxyisobutyrate dehydrogenase-like beta-hydroxyacid dehydrogenase